MYYLYKLCSRWISLLRAAISHSVCGSAAKLRWRIVLEWCLLVHWCPLHAISFRDGHVTPPVLSKKYQKKLQVHPEDGRNEREAGNQRLRSGRFTLVGSSHNCRRGSDWVRKSPSANALKNASFAKGVRTAAKRKQWRPRSRGATENCYPHLWSFSAGGPNQPTNPPWSIIVTYMCYI